MNVIFCGLPKSGKTTIGKRLAKKLNWIFIDTDKLIEKFYIAKTGKTASCREIFRIEGEVFFRNLEKQAIASLQRTTKSVIALGGGALNDPDNVISIKLLGRLVYLKVSLHTLWNRMAKDDLPAILDSHDPKKALHAIADIRTMVYETTSDIVIETTHLGEEDVAFKVMQIIG